MGRLLTTAVVLFPAPNKTAASRQTYKLVFPGTGRSLRRFASASLLPYCTVAQPERAMAKQISAKQCDGRLQRRAAPLELEPGSNAFNVLSTSPLLHLVDRPLQSPPSARQQLEQLPKVLHEKIGHDAIRADARELDLVGRCRVQRHRGDRRCAAQVTTTGSGKI